MRHMDENMNKASDSGVPYTNGRVVENEVIKEVERIVVQDVMVPVEKIVTQERTIEVQKVAPPLSHTAC